MSDHPSKSEIQSWIEGSLDESEVPSIETHLESCTSCEVILEELLQNENRTAWNLNSIHLSSLGSPGKKETTHDSAKPPKLPEFSGKQIDRYKLLQLLGQGGMGSVWMAEQQVPVRRNVALKIIKAGMDTREVIARFEAERQALAIMDHPNIARVLDGGVTDTGRPYFVMELVKGIPLTDYCDQAKLSTEQRLELFCDLCHATQHAHRKGIIHRDIKPSNVLVATEDATPCLKIIDFGLAKATGNKLTEKTLFTAVGQMMGTPTYMSPEQAKMTGLDVDTRTDVYSLGVLLYELLTGITPFGMKRFQKSSLAEIQRIIIEDDPPTPSSSLSSADVDSDLVAEKRGVEPATLVQKLRGDLDVIVMKAMEKDRNRRYDSPRDFANDIQCFLNQEPIQARPATKWYRFQRAYNRNRLAFWATGFVTATVLIGFAVSTYLAIKATRAEERANEALEIAKNERDHAVEAERLAESRRIESDAARKQAESVTETLTNVLTSPDPRREGNSLTVAEMLRSAVKACQEDLQQQPDLQNQLLTAIAQSFSAMQLYRDAAPLWEKVYQYNERESGQIADETLAAKKSLADAYLFSMNTEKAAGILKELIEESRDQYGEFDERTIAARHSLIKTSYPKQPEDAIEQWEKLAIVARDKLGETNSTTLNIMGSLCSGYHRMGQLDKSINERKRLIELHREVNGDDHPDTLAAQSGLVLSILIKQDYENALPIAREHLAACQDSLGKNHRTSLMAMDRLAAAYAGLDRYEESIAVQEEAVELRKQNLGNELRRFGITVRKLLRAYTLGGYPEKAEEMGRELVASTLRKFSEDDPSSIATFNNVAEALVIAPVQEKRIVQYAIELATKTTNADSDNHEYLTVLALALYRNQDWEASTITLNKAKSLSQKEDASLLAMDALLHWQSDEKESARIKLSQAKASLEHDSISGGILGQELVNEATRLIELEPSR